MGKVAARMKRTTSKTGDPVVDQLAVIDARGMFFSNLVGMGWRLALMVLVPIFIGVQLDKKFDSKPSITLAAFFIAIFGAGYLIARTYQDMQRQQLMDDMKKARRAKRKLKRSAGV